MSGTPVKVKPAHNMLVDACKRIDCLELARNLCPVGWPATLVVRCRWSVGD